MQECPFLPLSSISAVIEHLYFNLEFVDLWYIYLTSQLESLKCIGARPLYIRTCQFQPNMHRKVSKNSFKYTNEPVHLYIFYSNKALCLFDKVWLKISQIRAKKSAHFAGCSKWKIKTFDSRHATVQRTLSIYWENVQIFFSLNQYMVTWTINHFEFFCKGRFVLHLILICISDITSNFCYQCKMSIFNTS